MVDDAMQSPCGERDSVYRIVVERAPGFGEYQERTDRVIPVFELVTKQQHRQWVKCRKMMCTEMSRVGRRPI